MCWPELWGGLESLWDRGEHLKFRKSSHNYATEWGRLEADGTGGEGAFYIPLNPRNSANETLFSLLERLSLCPLLFLAIVCFLLLGAVRILRRLFLCALSRRFEILRGKKRSGYCPEKVPSRNHSGVGTEGNLVLKAGGEVPNWEYTLTCGHWF